MSVGAILVGIAVLMGVVVFIARPLFEEEGDQEPEPTAQAGPRAQLAARRDAVYALIRELDADHSTGKINSQDYQSLRSRYVAEGVTLLQQLDALAGSDGRAALEAEIEAQVLALRQAQAGPQAEQGTPGARFCTQCGQPADQEDRFCAHCGASLKEAAVQ